MINAKNLVSKALGGQHAQLQAPAPRSVDPATADVINKLFAELQSIFPAWKQAWPDAKAVSAAKRSWMKAFMAAGINTIEQIQFGLEQCRRSGGEFAPSVGRFVQWCQPTPEMLGLPSVEKAYAEAVRNAHPASAQSWSNQAVHHAACETGFHVLRTLKEDVSSKLFARNYAVTIRMLLAGEPLRAIPVALPESVAVCTPEVGRSALLGLRKALGGARG